MVKFYETSFAYDYPFPIVTLAYFLRYPNPHATHVLSTDVISRTFDPETHTLHTVRLHLKRSRLPSAILKLLPRSLLGASATGDTQSYILEHSVVDVRNGYMSTESQNLEWTGVLNVVEKQVFRRPPEIQTFAGCEKSAAAHGLIEHGVGEKTDVTTSVMLHSRLGQTWKSRRTARQTDAVEEQPPKMGFFKSWSTASLQRSIELIGLKRARRSQPNAKEGMKVVLERLREGGLVAVLEGMRRDREAAFPPHRHPFKHRFGNTAGAQDEHLEADEVADGFDE